MKGDVQSKNKLLTTKVGVWGLPSAGKTMFFVVFYKKCSKLLNGWTVKVGSAPGLTDTEASEAESTTLKWLDSEYQRILAKKTEMTVKTTEKAEHYLEVHGSDAGFGAPIDGLICWGDMPGENVIKVSDDVVKELLTCDAILCFIDPKPNTDNYKNLLKDDTGYENLLNIPPEELQKERFESLIQELLPKSGKRGIVGKRRQKKVKQTMAFIVTKIDLVSNYADMNINCDDHLIEALGDKDIMTFIKNYCEEYRTFVCSAVGFTEDNASNTQSIPDDQGGTVYTVANTATGWNPIGILEPIRYVLERNRPNRPNRS